MPEKKRLRILHVLLSRGFAGSERSTSESCNRQCEDHDVALVIRSDHRKNAASVIDHLDQRVSTTEVNARFFTRRQLKQAIDRFAPDVIHCHLRRSTRLVAQLNPKAATVSTLHIEVNGPHFLKMDGLICNARWQVEQAQAVFDGAIHKASNSLVPHRRLSDAEKVKLRQGLGLVEGEYLLGAVGRYHSSKAWDTLIKAFRQVQSDAARLLFFGSGSQEAELKQLAKGDTRIRFVGYRDDIKDLYQCFDLMLCPSRFEPLPRVMLEGYDAGVPMIASDAGGCKELIDDYGGEYFPVDDVDALASVLTKTIALRPAHYRPDLSAHYIENANAAMLAFYREVIAAKSLKLQS